MTSPAPAPAATYADLLLWGHEPYDSYSVFLIPGSAVPTADDLSAAPEFVTDDGEDPLGWGLDGAGDVDGDNYDDFVVSDHLNDTVYLVFGSAAPASGTLPVARFFTGPTESYVGFPASGVGDIDGNGLDDVLLGAPHDETTLEDQGVTYLVLSYGR